MEILYFIIIFILTLAFIGIAGGFGMYVAKKVHHDLKGKWKGDYAESDRGVYSKWHENQGIAGVVAVIVFCAVSYYTWVFLMAIVSRIEQLF